MSSKAVIVYLDDERRSYLNAIKRDRGTAATDTIRQAIDLHRDLNGSGGKSTGKLAEALCALVETMAPAELQQATKAMYAIREAFRAGEEAMRQSYRQKYNDKAKSIDPIQKRDSGKDKSSGSA